MPSTRRKSKVHDQARLDMVTPSRSINNKPPKTPGWVSPSEDLFKIPSPSPPRRKTRRSSMMMRIEPAISLSPRRTRRSIYNPAPTPGGLTKAKNRRITVFNRNGQNLLSQIDEVSSKDDSKVSKPTKHLTNVRRKVKSEEDLIKVTRIPKRITRARNVTVKNSKNVNGKSSTYVENQINNEMEFAVKKFYSPKKSSHCLAENNESQKKLPIPLNISPKINDTSNDAYESLVSTSDPEHIEPSLTANRSVKNNAKKVQILFPDDYESTPENRPRLRRVPTPGRMQPNNSTALKIPEVFMTPVAKISTRTASSVENLLDNTAVYKTPVGKGDDCWDVSSEENDESMEESVVTNGNNSNCTIL